MPAAQTTNYHANVDLKKQATRLEKLTVGARLMPAPQCT
jgi:hypothetical protein